MWSSLSYDMSMAEAINDAIKTVMNENKNVILVGEGVEDPRGLYGTTHNLQEKFGVERVMNMPLSENAIMGICTGAALSGLHPILVFQNMDHVIVALDQLINQTSKWLCLSNGEVTIPLLIRIIIGQNWVNGPQYCQSTHALLSCIKGINVIFPATPSDAKGMIVNAIESKSTTVCIEHISLYPNIGSVPTERYTTSIDRARVVREGNHVTIAAFSYTVYQSLRAAKVLSKEGIEVEVIDMRSANPLDITSVLKSLRKTGKLVVADGSISVNIVAAELITQVIERGFDLLKSRPIRISSTKHPVAFEDGTEKFVTSDAKQIAAACLQLMSRHTAVFTARVSSLLDEN